MDNFDEEIELDREKVKEMVPQKFHKWLKVFGKVESERMPTRKPWDHTINLKEDFVLKKGLPFLSQSHLPISMLCPSTTAFFAKRFCPSKSLKDISNVQARERESTRVRKRAVEKRIH